MSDERILHKCIKLLWNSIFALAWNAIVKPLRGITELVFGFMLSIAQDLPTNTCESEIPMTAKLGGGGCPLGDQQYQNSIHMIKPTLIQPSE